MNSTPLDFNAVVLSGGRSSRLGGVSKAHLHRGGRTLLSLTCDAVAAAHRTIVVGPDRDDGLPGDPVAGSMAQDCEFIRESPPFGGPAAALAAAVDHLLEDTTPWVLVLACDMPRIAQAIPVLLAAAAECPESSVVAHDGGRDQPLAALYRLGSLRTAVMAAQTSGGAQNLSMKALLARVQWRTIDVPPGSTADVDTWADAQSLGVSGTAPTETSGAAMKKQDQILQEWSAQLIEALELEGTTIDIDAILSLAGDAAHSIVRPAAPLTTFIAGYAAGLAVGSQQASERVAMESAIEAARRQCPTGDAAASTSSDAS
ncbi:NTP transferase domain-containing protein [Arthrobacter sp. HLT1-21]